MERLAEHTGSARSAAEGGRASEREDHAPQGVYWLHLATFSVYNALITYTLPLRFRTGIWFALLFVVAMALHFVLTDRSLSEHYPQRFARTGRRVLVAALAWGWVAAALFAPSRTVLVTVFTAFLAGGILLNVFKEELPSPRRSSYKWFLIGLVVYAALLTAVTALGE